LARRLNELNQLQVIEAAEDVVRRRHLQLLGSRLAGLDHDLVRARRQLETARHGTDLALIIEAEEQVCGILRQTTLMQRQAGAHPDLQTGTQSIPCQTRSVDKDH
jgi:hypothetical protein